MCILYVYMFLRIARILYVYNPQEYNRTKIYCPEDYTEKNL